MVVVSWLDFLLIRNIKPIYDLILQQKKNKLTFTCSITIKAFRIAYIIFAIYYVGQSIYSTIRKFEEGLIVVGITEKDYSQYVYPSITFCTKFIDGQKSSLLPYYNILHENSKNSGCIMDNIEIFGDSLFDDPKIVRNHHNCIDECNKTPQCNAWTLKEGFCYLKNESGILRPGGIKTYSGSKYCNTTSGCVYEGMTLDGGDLWAEWAQSFNHCSSICLADPSCKMWTYYIKDNLKTCHLTKTSSLPLRMARCENCISGFRDSTNMTCDKNFQLNESNQMGTWKSIIPSKSRILKEFNQRFSVFNSTLIDAFSDESLWEQTIPLEDSGPCFTYNPPVPSDPGWYYGIETSPQTTDIELNWPLDLEIFLHERDKFFYFKESSPPNNIRIYTNTLRSMNNVLILVKIGKTERLSKEGHRCNGNLDYNHFQCIESYFDKKRGCQYPWHYYLKTEANKSIGPCKSYYNISRHIANKDREFGAYRKYYTNSERTLRTYNQCPLPCNITSYELKYLINNEGSGKSLKIAFSDFRVAHRKEYLNCDTTCIIGEVGGNLGFFLGGSILIFFDILAEQVKKLQTFLDKNFSG